jgi:energy-converting hydrogenase Eha subunit B
MIAPALCLFSFLIAYLAGRRSLSRGLIALLAVGYFYGILRANLLTTYSHFTFDAALFGLYASQKWGKSSRAGMLRGWVIALVGWCLLLVLMPFQPLLVSLVGLRGNAFFIPVLLLGSRLKDRDLRELAGGMAVLNLVAIGFASAEYVLGVERFFPESAVTQIIYLSGDVAGGFFRIPAIFSSAHAYGGTMVASLPYLIGAWERATTRRYRLLIMFGIGAAMIGILMSNTRQNFILGSAMVLVAIFLRRRKSSGLVAFALLVGLVIWAAATNARFQRFKSLGDTDAVADRIAGSVNRTFFEILSEYPMGNGLGGGGTSIPYFLQGQVRDPIGMENEYARILGEQGIIGLVLWIGFVLWFLGRAPIAFAKNPWCNSRRMAWCLSSVSLLTAWIGIGMLTSIPQTAIQLLGMGWAATPQDPEPAPEAARTPLRLERQRPRTLATVRG